jgi:hypothetical protein
MFYQQVMLLPNALPGPPEAVRLQFNRANASSFLVDSLS